MKTIAACLFSMLVLRLCYSQNLYELIAKAEANFKRNHWEQSAKEFKFIVDNYQEELTYLQRADIYDNLGYLSLKLLDPIEAERYLNLSILYHEEGGIPSEQKYADALLNMGMLYLEQVEFDLARNHIQKSLDILGKLPENTTEYWVARSKMAYLYEKAGSQTLALSIYNECYDQLVASGNDLSPDFAEICSHKGRILIATGDPVEGEKFINLSTTIYESLGRDYDVERAESMEGLAVFYERMGRYSDAEKLLLEALEVKKSIPGEADILVIETLNDLGVMYHRMGRHEDSGEMFERVVKRCEESIGTTHPFYATAKNNLGTLALAKGDLAKARGMFSDALETYRLKFGVVHPHYANTLNNLARVERKMGNNEMAEKYYMEVLSIDEKIYGKMHPDYATTLINVGVLYSTMQRENEAEKYYQEALDIREEVLGVNHPAYGSALEYLGMHYLAVADYDKAEKLFRKSIMVQIDQIGLLFPIMKARERQVFYQNINSNIDRYNYIAVQLLDQKPELAKTIFDFRIKTKTILFNTVEKAKKNALESNEIDVLTKFRQWQSGKKLLASYYQMGKQELERSNINLKQEESRIGQLEKALEIKLEGFQKILPKTTDDWKSVQSQLSEGEAIVELVRIREFKSLASPQGVVFGFSDKTKYLAIIFQKGETNPDFALLGNNFKLDTDHFLLLQRADIEAYDTFWKPVHTKIEGESTVKVAADGIYNKFNLNALPISQDKNVIDQYYVSYITDIDHLSKPNTAIFNKKAYFFGSNKSSSSNALSMIELTEVFSRGGDWGIKSYLGDDAKELRVLSAYNPTVLHFSSCSFSTDKYNYVSDMSPMNHAFFTSGIYLPSASETLSKYTQGISSVPENDGILMTYEVMDLHLKRTQVVVLSSCVNNQNDAEGVYGMQRALVEAGANNIIFGLRKIEEAAENQLMKLFYEKFTKTNKVSESFKHAQLELRKKYKNPNVWGAFILVENG